MARASAEVSLCCSIILFTSNSSAEILRDVDFKNPVVVRARVRIRVRVGVRDMIIVN